MNMNAIDIITSILRRLDSNNFPLPATYIYNEGWMLRMVLQSIQDGLCNGPILSFEDGVNWTSEALLATPFSESRGRAYEGLTNADGVVGDFLWRPGTGEPLSFKRDLRRFEVFEAKMHSSLSKGVKSAPWYDQAVRNVACLAFALQAASVSNNDLDRIRLGFWVIAPESYINAGRFQTEMSAETMRVKIQMRIGQFQGIGFDQLELWRVDYFEPLLNHLLRSNQLRCLSWESLIEAVNCDTRKKLLSEFYSRCLDPFQLGSRPTTATDIVQGSECELLNRPGKIVHVCAVGPQRSRVFHPSSSTPSFLVQNWLLRPTGERVITLVAPTKSEIREFDDSRVVVISVGPCRSKVQFVDDPSRIEYVDNHRLKAIARTGS